MKEKTLIIVLILIGLGVGGFFIYKDIFQPEKEKRETVEVSNTTRTGKIEDVFDLGFLAVG